jgi:hypothetical protein
VLYGALLRVLFFYAVLCCDCMSFIMVDWSLLITALKDFVFDDGIGAVTGASMVLLGWKFSNEAVGFPSNGTGCCW